MKKWIIGLTMLTLAFVLPAVARAHEGHDHKVMGTVSSIDGKNLMVKTTDGKTVMVMLDAKTKITQGKTKVQASAVKIGDRYEIRAGAGIVADSVPALEAEETRNKARAALAAVFAAERN